MEWIGLIALGIALMGLGTPSRVKALERKIKKIETTDRKRKGENTMSKIIESLVGKRCKITYTSGLSSTCTVTEADEEWVKIIVDKKEKTETHIIRIDDIHEILTHE